MSGRRLVADSGGTNVRFALTDAAGNIEQLQTYLAADFPQFIDALRAYLKTLNEPPHLDAGVIAAAGPIDAGRVKLTNNDWTIDRDEVSAALSGAPVMLVNDLEAVAAALPHLAADDLDPVGVPAFKQPKTLTMLAVNIGTGFGAASALRRGGKWWTHPSEAGHMTLGPLKTGETDPWPEGAVIESLLSGQGVVDLYRQLAATARKTAEPTMDASDVFARASSDAIAAHAVDIFTTMFGRVVGDLVLATAAWGGVYLCGSVALGWSEIADPKKFRDEFTRKGAMQARIQRVPTAAIRRENVSLFGLAKMVIDR